MQFAMYNGKLHIYQHSFLHCALSLAEGKGKGKDGIERKGNGREGRGGERIGPLSEILNTPLVPSML